MTASALIGLAEARFDRRGNSNYEPCEIGLHICGCAAAFGSEYEHPYTAMNIEAATHAEAQAMFDAARAEAECEKDAHDFVCDLNLGGPQVGVEHVDDFYTNRQLMPRLLAAALRAQAASLSEPTPAREVLDDGR